MHTFFLKNIPQAGCEAELEKRERDHLFKTLRCRTGETLKLCDGKGRVATAAATAQQTVKITAVEQFERSAVQIHLFCALPRSNKLDVLLKPVTEAGVSSITPLKCRYSVAEKESVPERWHTLMLEACKQSGNPFLPEIMMPLSVSEAVDFCRKHQWALYFGDQHGSFLLPDDLAAAEKLNIAWLVGPEGGFDENELALLHQAGCGITLGEHIFRLENAALAGVAYLSTIARAALKNNQHK